MKTALVLIDNQRPAQCFWAGVDATAYDGADADFLDLDRCRRFTTEHLVELVRTRHPSGCHVITDGNLGQSNRQGADILTRLRAGTGFEGMRGVVFTAARKENAEALRGIVGCSAITTPDTPDKRVQMVTRIIRALVDGTKMPDDGIVALSSLKRAIHALQNLPVRLDAERSSETAQMPADLAAKFSLDCLAMWMATFGGPEPAILSELTRIAKEKDDTDRTLDAYLAHHGVQFSLGAMLGVDGDFQKAVVGAKTLFTEKFGDPGTEKSFMGWEFEDSNKMTARKALADALKAVETALDTMLIGKLSSIRKNLLG